MASWGQAALEAEPSPVRRLRDEVKDGLAVVAASALLSTLAALAVTVLMKLVS